MVVFVDTCVSEFVHVVCVRVCTNMNSVSVSVGVCGHVSVHVHVSMCYVHV